MSQIFISYSSSDRPWAETLEEQLIKAGMEVYRDQTRLGAGRPYQKVLFNSLQNSSVLLIIWSSQVRDMKGEWKEWVITEREYFRRCHPDSPIIYVLLDNEVPDVDQHIHKIDLIRGFQGPGAVDADRWPKLITKVKEITYSDKIEIIYYILAATKTEFIQLHDDPNILGVLESLNLKFDQVAEWYGDTRTDWKPAGRETIESTISDLEISLTRVLEEHGAPDKFKNRQILANVETLGLWSKDDPKIAEEIERIAQLEFCWIVIDPLSLYHSDVKGVVSRIATCAARNKWLNIFLVDPIGRILDRSNLRTKLQNDFSFIYLPLVKPQLIDPLTCLGGVDVWHVDDFERIFRETIRLHRQDLTAKTSVTSSKGALTYFGPK